MILAKARANEAALLSGMAAPGSGGRSSAGTALHEVNQGPLKFLHLILLCKNQSCV